MLLHSHICLSLSQELESKVSEKWAAETKRFLGAEAKEVEGSARLAPQHLTHTWSVTHYIICPFVSWSKISCRSFCKVFTHSSAIHYISINNSSSRHMWPSDPKSASLWIGLMDDILVKPEVEGLRVFLVIVLFLQGVMEWNTNSRGDKHGNTQ